MPIRGPDCLPFDRTDFNDNGYIAPFLSMNQAIGLETSWPRLCVAMCQTVKTLPDTGMPHERASEWFTALGSLA
jgi:hypothetical protein